MKSAQSVNRQSLLLARTYKSRDFEDNLQIACAKQTGLDAIITRDAVDFQSADIAVLTPEQALAQLSNSQFTIQSAPHILENQLFLIPLVAKQPFWNVDRIFTREAGITMARLLANARCHRFV